MATQIVACAECGTPVITKYKSKARCCSDRCYMRTYRARVKLKQATQDKPE